MNSSLNSSQRRSGDRPRSASAPARLVRPLLGHIVGHLVGPVAVLALAVGLTGCGSDDGGGSATDPAGSTCTSTPTETETPTETPAETPTEEPGESAPSEPADGDATTIPATGSAGVTEATLVHATEGDGSPSTLAFALDTDQAVQDFVVGLRSGLPERVTSAVADVAQQSPDATPYGAVVSTGCEPPRGVAIEAGEAGFEVVPRLPKSTVQCLAPVTYVVVFAAPDA